MESKVGTILIDAASGGGYQIHTEYKDVRVKTPKKSTSIWDALDTAYYLIVHTEQDMGVVLYLVITPEATRVNRKKDKDFWLRLSDPTFRPTLPRLIRDPRDIEEDQ